MKGFEIERKYLTVNKNWEDEVFKKIDIKQIYFSPDFFYCLFHKNEENDLFFEIHNNDKALSVKIDSETKELILKNDNILFNEQGDFNLNNEKWVSRLRIQTATLIYDENEVSSAEITVKGPNVGIVKPEYNFNINNNIATELFDSAQSLNCNKIEKVRNILNSDEEGVYWEVDVFSHPKSVKGLILAEIEIPNVEHKIALPDWIGEEVSEDPRYFNKNMV